MRMIIIRIYISPYRIGFWK